MQRYTGIALAGRAFGLSKTCHQHQPKLSYENELITDWLIALMNAKKTWGFGLCVLHLHNVKDFTWNHKRVYYLARQAPLAVRVNNGPQYVSGRLQSRAEKAAIALL